MKPKILTTMRGYTSALLLSDALAGLTVAMVAIPLCIAIASGTEPAKGLVTAIIGGSLISLLGGSRVQIGGPTGTFILVVYGVISTHGYDGLVQAMLMAGVILIAAGWLRVVELIAYVPEAAVNGLTIGIAIIIAFSELGDLLGLDRCGVPAEIFARAPAIWAARAQIDPLALATGLVTLVLIVALRRAFPCFPGLVVAVVVVSAAVALAGVPVETIAGRFGELLRALPWSQIPPIALDRLIALLPLARIIAFVAAVESLLSAIVADRMIGGQHRPNAEVNAPGWGNPGSALFGGMPATGVIARTAGARTLMSTPLPVSTTVSSRAEGDLDGEPPAGINPRTQSGGIGQGKGNARH